MIANRFRAGRGGGTLRAGRGGGALRAGLGGVTLMAAVALAAGCGSTSGSGTSASSAAPSSQGGSASAGAGSGSPAASSPAAPVAPASKTPATSLAACATANLSVSLVSNMGGGAAGSTYVPIQFTNTSGTACSMFGFPGVSFVTGQNGSQIGAPAQRSGSSAKVTVTLAAHATAHAWLQIADAGNYPASSCHVTNANWLKIYPPGNTAAAYVNHSFQTCSSAKVVTMTIDPVRTGAAVQGQLP
jgi:Domain of unknown function (DUF4232)